MRLGRVLIIPLACFSTPSFAQDMPVPDYVGGWFTTSFQNEMLIDRERDDNSKQRKSVQTAPIDIPSTSQLRYVVSQQRRVKNMQDFAEKSSRGNTAYKNQLLATLKSGEMIASIDSMMRPLGLRADNVADAYTLWSVIAWNAVHGHAGTQNTETLKAVKSQSEQALISTSQIALSSDAAKQQFAETLLIQAALIEAGSEDAAGNPTKQAALAKAVNQGAKKMGLDLTKMTLTEDGFVPRSGGRSAVEGADEGQRAANDAGDASEGASLSDYALYAAASTGLLAGVFAIGKGLSKRG